MIHAQNEQLRHILDGRRSEIEKHVRAVALADALFAKVTRCPRNFWRTRDGWAFSFDPGGEDAIAIRGALEGTLLFSYRTFERVSIPLPLAAEWIVTRGVNPAWLTQEPMGSVKRRGIEASRVYGCLLAATAPAATTDVLGLEGDDNGCIVDAIALLAEVTDLHHGAIALSEERGLDVEAAETAIRELIAAHDVEGVERVFRTYASVYTERLRSTVSEAFVERSDRGP